MTRCEIIGTVAAWTCVVALAWCTMLSCVSAEPPPAAPHRVRVLSYNIHHGEGVDGRLDLARIAKVITSVEPDLVALQEVDKNTRRTNHVDQAAELGRLTAMQHLFGGNIHFQGGDYGNAVLAKWKVVRHENHLLPSLGGGEQRGLLEVEVAIPGAAPADGQTVPSLIVFATHLDARPAEMERLQSAAAINARAQQQPARLQLLAGDLNAVPASETLRVLLGQWSSTTADKPLATSPSQSPRRQIDYVLFRPGARLRVVEARVLDESVASDHRPLLAVLEWTAE